VAQYETLDETLENDYSFMQTYNVGEKITVHKIDGHIQSRIVYYLMNIKVTPRTIYLTRHGESEDNVAGRLGGDSDLSERGHRYARRLAEFINGGECASSPNFKVWTSWMKRSIQTAKHINCTQDRWKTLNEIDTGVCDEMTYEEVREFYPDEFAERDKDKFMYRYPRGESYEDLVARLEPVIMEIERQDSVLVVCHQAVIRCLLGYYLESSMDDMPWLEVPLHTVIKLEPIAYGCRRKDIALGIDSVSTHRGRPPVPGFLEDRFRRKPVRSRTVSMEPETIAEADGEVENGSSL
jgi:6-phosphofructo-2-kinase/fructose-2,6-biphosphatase 2